VSIFLGLSQRYRAALETFDPLRGEPLLRVVDPWPGAKRDGRPAWHRIGIILLMILGPQGVFSALPSTTCGSRLFGKGGLATDIGVLSVTLFIACTLGLLPIVRRVLGDLINELILLGVAKPGLRSFSPASCRKRGILRFLEWASRVNGARCVLWYLLFAADQLLIYHVFLSDGKPTWQTSPAGPGTLFYLLRVGNEQPNLAGVWNALFVGPIGLYLVVLIARLTVVFACLCSELAGSEKTVIIPAHPDNTGGLKPVGQVSLLLALFTFILGINLAGMTVNELVVKAAFRPELPHGDTNLLVIVGLWALYLVVGSILFFLPLVPLHGRMAAVKRRYLTELNTLLVSAARKHEAELQHKNVDLSFAVGAVALDNLVHTVEGMAVWPFDRQTFRRYAGLLISPLAPLVIDQLPRGIALLKAYLGLG
jgi:hypothetical protein